MIRDLAGSSQPIGSNGAVLANTAAVSSSTGSSWIPVLLDAVHKIRRPSGSRVRVRVGTSFAHEANYATSPPIGLLLTPGARTAQDAAVVSGTEVTGDAEGSPAARLRRCSSSTAESDRTSCWSASELLGDALTATHSAGHDIGLVEVSAAGVSKASMLRRYCARLGVDARTRCAFGDMPNDVAMLAWAGMPYVVANAHPLLRRGQFPVVPANDESGVGRTIKAGWPVDRRAPHQAHVSSAGAGSVAEPAHDHIVRGVADLPFPCSSACT